MTVQDDIRACYEFDLRCAMTRSNVKDYVVPRLEKDLSKLTAVMREYEKRGKGAEFWNEDIAEEFWDLAEAIHIAESRLDWFDIKGGVEG